MQLAENSTGSAPSIPHLWIRSESPERFAYLSEVPNPNAVINVEGEGPRTFTSRNVIGVIKGTDPVLKDEYILLAAHYDHVRSECSLQRTAPDLPHLFLISGSGVNPLNDLPICQRFPTQMPSSTWREKGRALSPAGMLLE